MEMFRLFGFLFCVTLAWGQAGKDSKKKCVVYNIKELGCYMDSGEKRILGGPNFNSKKNEKLSRESCLQMCYEQGMRMAGAEHGIY